MPPVKILNLDEWVDHLRKVGVEAGDLLMVHSAVQFLGALEGGVAMLYRGLREVLGPEGAMVFPTFNHGFCKGQLFDVQHTPCENMGVLNEYVRTRPETRRSLDPILPVAAVGPLAGRVVGGRCVTCFGPGSPFDMLVRLGGKLLLIGASFQYASIVHLVEERLRVPYRYMKEFKGIRRHHGHEEHISVWMYARDLEVDPQLDLLPMGERLHSLGLVNRQPVNYGYLQLSRLEDLMSYLTVWIRDDPYFLLGAESKAQVLKAYAALGGPPIHPDAGSPPQVEWSHLAGLQS